jgi:cyclase
MLRSRIIPCLLVHNKGLVKTTKFKDPKYVGDPINAVKIFNEKEVDELMVLDIDASALGKEPDLEMIKNLAAECRMPFCYGGGITTAEQAKAIIKLGAEKIAVSSAVINDINLLSRIGTAIGMQSVVVVIDVKKKGFLGGFDIYIENGKKKANIKLVDLLKTLNTLKVGEVVINSIDADGTMAGYDIDLIELVRNSIDMPMTVIGGAGSFDDFSNLISKYKTIGVAAGSLFVFKGKYRAVLISYPSKEEKRKILGIS